MKEAMYFLSLPLRCDHKPPTAGNHHHSHSWRPRSGWSSWRNHLRLRDCSIFTKRRRWRDDTDRRRATFPSFIATRNSFMTLVIRERSGEVRISSVQTALVSHLLVAKSVFISRLNTSPIKHHQQGAGCHTSGQEGLITASSRAQQYSIITITNVLVVVVHSWVNCRGPCYAERVPATWRQSTLQHLWGLIGDVTASFSKIKSLVNMLILVISQHWPFEC